MGAPSPQSQVLTITLFVKGELVNPKNGGRHGHWAKTAAWKYEWRRQVRLAWLDAGRPKMAGPALITFTAHVGRLWDPTNLALGVAPVQDEAMYLMCEGAEDRPTKDGRIQRVAPDGPEHGHQIVITQAVRPDYRGVLVTVTPLAADAGGRG